jgi:hypothetical protein
VAGYGWVQVSLSFFSYNIPIFLMVRFVIKIVFFAFHRTKMDYLRRLVGKLALPVFRTACFHDQRNKYKLLNTQPSALAAMDLGI